jgi:conjugal transfer pilus assembly protein TraV
MTARRLLSIGAALLLLPLAACVNMSGLDSTSKYACAAPKGVACNSVSGNYANALRNNLPGQRSASGNASAKTTGNAPATAFKTPQPQPSVIPAPDANTPQPQALRSQGRYLRLWIKPWEDTDGDLFDQTYLYVQVDQGRWQIEHVRQAIRDRYAPLRPPLASAASAVQAVSDSASPAPPAQRPSGSAGFPLLNTPASTAGSRPAGGIQ